MKIFALLAVLAACSAQADDYPIQPGGGGALPTSGGGGSATALTGRACIVDDPRVLDACSSSAATPAADMAITLDGTPITTTAADGTFTLPATSGPGATIGITGTGVVPTQLAVATAAGTTTATTPSMSVPLVSADLFSQMLAANGITPESGSGSILGSVVRGTAPASGVTVSSTPSPAFGPLFDGSTPTAWTLDATGARGVVWVPGVTVGPTQLTFTDLATSGSTTVDGVSVIDGGITIVDAVLP